MKRRSTRAPLPVLALIGLCALPVAGQDEPPLPGPTAEAEARPEPEQDPAPEAGQEEPAPAPEVAAPPRLPAAPAAESPARPGRARRDGRYHDLEAVAALLDDWVRHAPAGVRVEALDLGRSAGGRPVPAIQLGRVAPGAPASALAEQPTLLLVGGLDGVSLAGSEAVLAAVDRLLAQPELLPLDVTLVAVPWGSPDGLARTFASGALSGTNDRPVDSDHDGALDEDGPDDLDGDGLILEMLVADPEGPWTRSPDLRFLVPARDGDAPRYRRVLEGRDDDGDGLYNEDGPGGVQLDLGFPVGWRGAWSGRPAGDLPLSEPLARALADLALARKTAGVVLFQGNHGGLATPGGLPPAELGWELPAAHHRPVFGRLATRFAEATGRPRRDPQPLHALGGPAGASRAGAALDWFYASAGAVAIEVAAWGPVVVKGTGSTAIPARYTIEPPAAEAASAPEPALAERLDPDDVAWSAWLDNTRGGLGFVDWHPVELGDGGRALVGGWEPRTRDNPPAEELEAALAGLPVFVQGLAESLPRLEIVVREVERRGEVCHLVASVRNRGDLPTGLEPGPHATVPGCRLVLRLPSESTLLAGPEEVDLGHLPGAGTSAEIEWLVQAPQGKTLSLEAEGGLTPRTVVEVQP